MSPNVFVDFCIRPEKASSTMAASEGNGNDSQGNGGERHVPTNRWIQLLLLHSWSQVGQSFIFFAAHSCRRRADNNTE